MWIRLLLFLKNTENIRGMVLTSYAQDVNIYVDMGVDKPYLLVGVIITYQSLLLYTGV